jgi:hypothetical protein
MQGWSSHLHNSLQEKFSDTFGNFVEDNYNFKNIVILLDVSIEKKNTSWP